MEEGDIEEKCKEGEEEEKTEEATVLP